MSSETLFESALPARSLTPPTQLHTLKRRDSIELFNTLNLEEELDLPQHLDDSPTSSTTTTTPEIFTSYTPQRQYTPQKSHMKMVQDPEFITPNKQTPRLSRFSSENGTPSQFIEIPKFAFAIEEQMEEKIRKERVARELREKNGFDDTFSSLARGNDRTEGLPNQNELDIDGVTDPFRNEKPTTDYLADYDMEQSIADKSAAVTKTPDSHLMDIDHPMSSWQPKANILDSPQLRLQGLYNSPSNFSTDGEDDVFFGTPTQKEIKLNMNLETPKPAKPTTPRRLMSALKNHLANLGRSPLAGHRAGESPVSAPSLSVPELGKKMSPKKSSPEKAHKPEQISLMPRPALGLPQPSRPTETSTSQLSRFSSLSRTTRPSTLKRTSNSTASVDASPPRRVVHRETVLAAHPIPDLNLVAGKTTTQRTDVNVNATITTLEETSTSRSTGDSQHALKRVISISKLPRFTGVRKKEGGV